MKTSRKLLGLIKFQVVLISVFTLSIFNSVLGQDNKTLLFDTFHGQNPQIAAIWTELLPDNSKIDINSKEIKDSTLQNIDGLIIFSPRNAFLETEKIAIKQFLRSGRSLLLIFDQESRTPIGIGVNDIILPFGMELTDDIPVPHNCGAIADSSKVCSQKRELPYSGGRSIKGGSVISKVYDKGDFVHCAYSTLPNGGKIIVMSDGMAGLLLGKPDGERFSGTGPSDSKYWGKDSRIFMEEILSFMIK